MSDTRPAEYELTVLQHTYCSDCMWMKGKITDVYHASGIVRGNDSKHWRMQILSPPWDRDKRKAEFPTGFATVDVPALKLEVDGQVVFATQSPELINELLIKLKAMLMNNETNLEIQSHLNEFVVNWREASGRTTCLVTTS